MVTANQVGTTAPFIILRSRLLYSTTRISLEDDPQSLPAIKVGQQYYSFFRTLSEVNNVLELTSRLCDRNNSVAVTKIPKGYSLWIKETTAIPKDRNSPPASTPSPSVCYYLKHKNQYRPLRLKLPKLDLPVLGIQFKKAYYSIFCKEGNLSSVLEIVSQLAEWENETIIIHHKESFMICILEPEARPQPKNPK